MIQLMIVVKRLNEVNPIIYMMILILEMIALPVMRKMNKRWEKSDIIPLLIVWEMIQVITVQMLLKPLDKVALKSIILQIRWEMLRKTERG